MELLRIHILKSKHIFSASYFQIFARFNILHEKPTRYERYKKVIPGHQRKDIAISLTCLHKDFVYSAILPATNAHNLAIIIMPALNI